MQPSNALQLALLAVTVVACSDSSSPEPSGRIAVTITTTGQGKDLDGYLVVLAGRPPVRIPSAGSAQIEGISPGTYSVELQDIADNCEPVTVPVSVSIVRDSTSAIDVAIDCHLDLHGRIVFMSAQYSPGQIMAMYPDGSQRYRVIESDSLDGDPDVSADGQFMVFKRFVVSNDQLRVLNLSTGVITPLPVEGLGQFRPEWSPDGSKIAFMVADAQSLLIWVVDADGGNPHPVTSAPGFDTDPSWSPDGNWIVFGHNGTLQRVPAAGGQPETLPCLVVNGCLQPAYSPDGQRIVYTGSVGLNDTDLFLRDVNGTSVDTLTTGPDNDQAAVWSPDGASLVFLRILSTGGIRLYRLDLDGSEPVDISSGHEDQQPDWSSGPQPQ